MKKLLKNLSSYKPTVVLITLLVVTTSSDLIAIAKPEANKYGLGLPASTGTAGAVRSGALPPVVLMAPEDGGRTVSQKPTFYWYLASNLPYKTIFQIKDGETGEIVIKVGGVSTKNGLYKFTVPEATNLKSGKVYTWQLTFNQKGSSSGFSSIGQILLAKKDPEVQKALINVNNDLAKAKIYSNYGYWYDALTLYNNWLEIKPTDSNALQERNKMISEVFTAKETGNKLLAEANVSKFVSQLSTNLTAQPIALTPKTD